MSSPALQEAIILGDSHEVQFLLQAGASINAHFPDGSTPLNTALAHHHEELAHTLLDLGADEFQTDSFRLDCCERQPVHYAAACGLLGMVKRLLGLGVEVDEPDYGQATPLHHAAANGNIDIVEYLLSEGCDINSASNSGRTALWKAARAGYRETVHLLFAEGANINTQNRVGVSLLSECVREGASLAIAKDLIYFGADVNLKDIEGNTALHGAASLGRTPQLEMLMNAGVKVNHRNDYGNTALCNAAMHGKVNCCVQLLNFGAEFKRLNCSGQSPMYCAMLHQQSNTTTLLHILGAGLSLNERTMYESYEATRCDEKHVFYLWTVGLRLQPRTLKEWCRIAIRASLTEKPILAIDRLPLPQASKSFLLLHDHIVEEPS